MALISLEIPCLRLSISAGRISNTSLSKKPNKNRHKPKDRANELAK